MNIKTLKEFIRFAEAFDIKPTGTNLKKFRKLEIGGSKKCQALQ